MAGNPNSCLLKIGNQKFRSLVDTGADVSLINKKIFQNLKERPRITRARPSIQSVNGEAISVEGCADISFKLGNLILTHTFYIVDGINRNLILGRDWLKKNGVRIYFDLGYLRVGKTYVRLEEDIHISSILRLTKKTLLRPQTTTICTVKLNNGFKIPDSGLLEVSEVDFGYLSKEPGLVVCKAITKIRNPRRIPIMVVNQTNKFFNLKRGTVIGKGESIQEQEIKFLNEITEQEQSEYMSTLQVPPEHKGKLEKILSSNRDLFAQKDSELGHTSTVEMRIDTGMHPPIKNRPYRIPINKRQVVDKAIDEMLDAKIIERSRSPWSFPLVVVDKKDGSKRMCVDFRSLNKILKPISFPLPLIDDILTLLGSAKYFSTLDQKSGYWQVLLESSSKEKTAFTCHRGLFQFNVMPFGISTAPALFQELANIVLQGCESYATAYLDDIIIFSKTADEHCEHIQDVFNRLRNHGLKLKLKKCKFFQQETDYLGFVINREGVKPDPKKVEAIRNMPAPTTVRQVRGFMGIGSYYRRFLPNFSKIAEPLIYLTRKHARFKWTKECQKAFDFLKDSLTVVPLLSYPDPNKPYKLYTDASDTCIGACLTQTDDEVEKPIYFLSHKLSQSQVKWSTIEKEAFAIHYALQKLDHYLHNAEFVIYTDHCPLRHILDAPMQNKKIQLWALGIAGYNCKVEYIAGKANSCADLLSRMPDTEDVNKESDKESPGVNLDIDDRSFEISTLNSNKFNPRKYASCDADITDDVTKPEIDFPEGVDIQEEQDNDETIQKLKKRLREGNATKTEQNRHMIIEGLVYFLSNADANPTLRLYVPESLKSLVVKQYHDHLGHMAIDKTYDTIRLKYYFPNMYKELYEYIDKCIVCQTRSAKRSKPPLHETDIPPYPFAKIGLDLSGPYPRTLSGNRYIVSFIDLYSGWPEAFAVPDKSAENIVHLLVDEIFPVHSSPLQLLTDNGSEQVNRAVRETLEALNIHHVTTSYYSPQGNGKVERFHKTMHDIIAKKIKEDVSSWDIYLNQMLAAIRFHVSDSSKFSPFFLLYNRDPVLPLDNILKPRRKYTGEEFHKIALQQQHKSFALVHKHLKEAKKRQSKYADKGSKEVELKVGDPVYVRNHRKTSKLDNKWTPYYRIIEQTSPVSFIIKNQLTGSTTKAHARHLRPANIDNWEIPKENQGRPLRKSIYVVPPEDSNDNISTDESDEDIPLAKIAKKYRKERDDWSSEEDIPLMELKKRLRNKTLQTKNSPPNSEKEMSTNGTPTDDENSEQEMMVETATVSPKINKEINEEKGFKSNDNEFKMLVAKTLLAVCNC